MSLTPITLNGQTIRQPTTLTDDKEFQQTDKQALDGAMQRNRISTPANPRGFKYRAMLTWEDLPVADFQILDNLFTTGSGLVYSNPSSKYGVLTYSGLPMNVKEGPYASGESLLTSYQVMIRQI